MGWGERPNSAPTPPPPRRGVGAWGGWVFRRKAAFRPWFNHLPTNALHSFTAHGVGGVGAKMENRDSAPARRGRKTPSRLTGFPRPGTEGTSVTQPSSPSWLPSSSRPPVSRRARRPPGPRGPRPRRPWRPPSLPPRRSRTPGRIPSAATPRKAAPTSSRTAPRIPTRPRRTIGPPRAT